MHHLRRSVSLVAAAAVLACLCSPADAQRGPGGFGGHNSGRGNAFGQPGGWGWGRPDGWSQPGPLLPPVNGAPVDGNTASAAGLQFGRALMAGAGTAVHSSVTSPVQINAALGYVPDPRLSVQVRAAAVATLSARDPSLRPRLEQAFTDAALRDFDGLVAAHGFSSHNVADAMAALLWTSWQIVSGDTLTEVQIRAIHHQARAVFMATPELNALPAAVRQQIAENAAYTVFTLAAARRNAGDPAALAWARQAAPASAKSLAGIDLAELEVTPDSGFRPKRAAPPPDTGPAAVQTHPHDNPDVKECTNDAGPDVNRRIEACTRAIAAIPGNTEVLLAAYGKRGHLYGEARQFDRMMADYEEIVRLAPQNPMVYVARAGGWIARRDYDRALADVEKVLASQPGPATADAYALRGNIYLKRASYDRAMADTIKAISIRRDVDRAWAVRALAQLEQGHTEAAVSDLNEAIRLAPRDEQYRLLRAEIQFRQGHTAEAEDEINQVQGWNPRSAGVRLMRGRLALAQSRIEVALGELTQAIELDDQQLVAFTSRAAAYERIGQTDHAIGDYRRALTLIPDSKMDRDAQVAARERIVALMVPAANTPPVAHAPAVAAPATAVVPAPGRRIALVIGMSAYVNVPALRNPANDARAVADLFRRLGFAEVIEREDMTRAKLEETLKDFGDKAGEADWAVIYYAGHGFEINGVNYLVPVDAKLARADHAEDEAVTLTRVTSKAEGARQLGIVILDACRNNPFRMAAAEGRTRAVGRGLSPIEPARGVLVAYAARDGTTAEDGDSEHSPFTQALLTHLETPGVEIRVMFGKVHDQVLARTGKTQEPYTYGALPGQEFYFREAAR
jgi:tetratricopeptide (TPR) repeat protein